MSYADLVKARIQKAVDTEIRETNKAVELSNEEFRKRGAYNSGDRILKAAELLTAGLERSVASALDALREKSIRLPKKEFGELWHLAYESIKSAITEQARRRKLTLKQQLEMIGQYSSSVDVMLGAHFGQQTSELLNKAYRDIEEIKHSYNLLMPPSHSNHRMPPEPELPPMPEAPRTLRMRKIWALQAAYAFYEHNANAQWDLLGAAVGEPTEENSQERALWCMAFDGLVNEGLFTGQGTADQVMWMGRLTPEGVKLVEENPSVPLPLQPLVKEHHRLLRLIGSAEATQARGLGFNSGWVSLRHGSLTREMKLPGGSLPIRRLAETLVEHGLLDMSPDADSKVRLTESGRQRLIEASVIHQGPVAHKEKDALSDEIDPRRVFIIHGRNHTAVTALTHFLHALGLKAWTFEEASTECPGDKTVFNIVDFALRRARAIVALFTPDEWSALSPMHRGKMDRADDIQRWSARANVYLEAGLALRDRKDDTILVSMGPVAIPSDLGGFYVMRLSNDPEKRTELRKRLEGVKCSISADSAVYLNPTKAGDFESCIGVLPSPSDPFVAPGSTSVPPSSK